MVTSYALARCELHSKARHGNMGISDEFGKQIICMESIPVNDIWTYCDQLLWLDAIHFIRSVVPVERIKSAWNRGVRINKQNWRVFCNALSKCVCDPYYNHIHIVKKNDIEDDEGYIWTTTIIKTFWIKIVQRKWKKIFKMRHDMILQRMNPINIMHWNLDGRWPYGMNRLPSLYDMNL